MLMHKNDNLIIQIAVAMIIIALLGLIMIRASERDRIRPLPAPTAQPVAVRIQQWAVWDNTFQNADQIAQQDTVAANQPTANIVPRLVENVNSDESNLVNEYFVAMEAKDYTRACATVSPDKCRASNETSVELFSREHQKYTNGYEYTNVKDLWFKSPSGKNIVCVKYSYRIKNDADPRLVSEILSYYVDRVDGQLKVTDRVCEKKYKEWSGNRPCPIEPNARYCVGNVK